MNRRNFLKLTGTIGIFSILPVGLASIPPAPIGITWKDFEWMPEKIMELYRLEGHQRGGPSIYTLAHKQVCAKYDYLGCVYTPLDQDLTQEQEQVNISFGSPNQIVFTNEQLLTQAKRLGYTHLYKFIKQQVLMLKDRSLQWSYIVCGVKEPEWARCKDADGIKTGFNVITLPNKNYE